MSKYKKKTERLDWDYFEMTQQEIAVCLDISQQAVQNTELRAMKKFKERMLNEVPDIITVLREI